MIIPALLIEKYNNIEYKYIGHGKKLKQRAVLFERIKACIIQEKFVAHWFNFCHSILVVHDQYYLFRF